MARNITYVSRVIGITQIIELTIKSEGFRMLYFKVSTVTTVDPKCSP